MATTVALVAALTAGLFGALPPATLVHDAYGSDA
jgi:hypothetical protein